jgi:predicted outer membrane repeat protein
MLEDNMRQVIILFFLIAIISMGAVTINIPDDYATIQDGIDASIDGDEVIAAPGIYVENINFGGKGIIVGSWYYTTQDTSYISQTIIDGDQNGSVVRFCYYETSSSELTGFTIRNGTGIGAGIDCFFSSPALNHLIIENNSVSGGNSGGGINFRNSDTSISDIIFINNTAGSAGGGLFSHASSLELENLVFRNNSAMYGGGIFLSFSNAVFKNVIITGNTASISGGGLYCLETNADFDSNQLSNIYLNNSNMRDCGADIYCDLPVTVVVDTFTVMNPTGFHASPLENFTFSILNSCQGQIAADLYVSPEGDNSNSGLTAEEPLRSIQYACSIMLSCIQEPLTIFLAEGIYSRTNSDEYFPVNLPSHVSLCGVNAETVVLDAENLSQVITLNEVENTRISNLSVTNGMADRGGGIYCNDSSFNIENVMVNNNQARLSGGGIYCEGSNLFIDNVTITDNQAGSRAGICIDASSGNISNSTITYNDALNSYGGIWCSESDLEISSVTISHNTAGHSGGGISCENNEYLSISDAQITDNSAGRQGGGIYCYYDNPDFAHILLRDNYSAMSGGGIFCFQSSHPYLTDMTITGNSAGFNGGGICCLQSATVNFNALNRCSLYLNNVSYRGNGSEIYSDSFINVIVDTFTVINPTEFQAAPLDNFDFDILNAMQELVDADLYVSPEGDNSNSGLDEQNPLQTIRYATSIIMADSLNTHTIYLAEGIYSFESNNEFFPIDIPSGVTLQGAGEAVVLLDADSLASVIRLEQVNNVIVSDLTVINGYSRGNGGGIFCESSSLNISNVTVLNSSAILFGGGIYSLYSDIVLDNVTISDNHCRWKGGGLYLDNSSLQISNAQITNNISEEGGGIYSDFSDTSWENVTITGNRADFGGGFYNQSQNTVFNDQNRCNIYLNNVGSRGMGVDIFSVTEINVVVDTFTVLNPSAYHAAYLENFTFDIQHGFLEQVGADLYVSPQGDNQNSGLDADHPLQTISYACAIILADELSPRTICLSEGLYSPTANSEAFPIHLPDYVTLQGNDETDTVLDAEGCTTVFLLFDCSDVNLNDLTIINGYDDFYGGGIYSFFSNACLDHVTIANCHSDNFGGGISSRHSQLKLINVTITQNSSANVGGGICVSDCGSDSLTIINSIFWENYPHEIDFFDVYPSPTLTIAFTDISGGEEGLNSYESNTIVNWLIGNTEIDPLFVDANAGDFSLSENSICIDSGIAYFEYNGEALIDVSENEYYGRTPDLGSHEYFIDEIETDELITQNSKLKIQSYPNPFNPETNIVFELSADSDVLIEIYNIKGQKVTTLVDAPYKAGRHQFTWKAENLSSGIYLLNMIAEGDNTQKKLILLK